MIELNKKVKLIGIILTLTILSNFYSIPFVLAYSYTDIGFVGWDTFNDNTYRPHQSSSLSHSSGYFVSSQVNGQDDIALNVIDTDGNEVVDLTIAIGTTGTWVRGIRVSEYNVNYTLITAVEARDSGTYDGIFITVVRLDMRTLSYVKNRSTEKLQPSISGNVWFNIMTSEIHCDTDNDFAYWFMLAFRDNSGNPDTLCYLIVSYDVINNLTDTVSTGTSGFGNSNDFQAPVLTSISTSQFTIMTVEGATQTPDLTWYDITSNNLTGIGIYPSSYRMYYEQQFTVFANDIEYVSGNDTAYHYIAYASGSNLGSNTPTFQVVYLRSSYNNSVHPDNLYSLTATALDVSPYSNPVEDGNPWTLGHLDNDGEDLRTLIVYYPKYDYYDGIYHNKLAKLTCIVDFYDLADTIQVDSNEDDYETAIPVFATDDLVYRNMQSEYQSTLNLINEWNYIYYDLAVVIDDFVMTIDYIPDDSPLYLAETYEFTYTFLNGGTAYQGGIVLIYIDTTLVHTSVSDNNGEVNLDIIFQSIGNHSIRVRMFKTMLAGSSSIDQTNNYIVIATGEEGEPYELDDITLFSDNLMKVVMELIPIAVCVLFPAYWLGKVGGISGFLGGMVIGTAIGVKASLIPVQYVYLIALTVVMGVVFAIRTGGMQRQ